MAAKPNFTPTEWLTLRSLAKQGGISVTPVLIDKIRTGERALTERLAIEIHRATNGQIPCWRSRPDTWPEGVLPPVLQTHGAAS